MQEAVLSETWTTFPSRQTPAPYAEPSYLQEVREQDGAGPAATVRHGSWLLWLQGRWGYPLYPEEPTSLSTAKMQQEISEYTHRYRIWFDEEQKSGLPLATHMRVELETWLSIMWEHMTSLIQKEIPTSYTMAAISALDPEKKAERYETMEATPAPGNRIDFKELKARIDIVQYIGRYTELKQAGRTMRGRCPLHNEKTASFYVYPKNQSYYCFGCQKGGDVIDFAKAMGVERLA